jgi:hypothetical protein
MLFFLLDNEEKLRKFDIRDLLKDRGAQVLLLVFGFLLACAIMFN